MRISRALLLAGVATTVIACSNDNTTASTPVTPPTTTPPVTAGAARSVTVGDIFFQSASNSTRNPAVDTVAAGSTVTWTWASTETLPHSVQSMGSPSFTSSRIQTGGGNSYQFTFPASGTYQYNCAVHGQLMTGTIVVQ
jgi:plastocyanin